MSLAGIERALEASGAFARALDQSSGDADFSVDEGLRAPLIAGLIGRRRLAGDVVLARLLLDLGCVRRRGPGRGRP